MNIIKNKQNQITKLSDDLENAQNINNGMKKEVIQLKQMINQFIQSYSHQIGIRDQQIGQKNKQILQLKQVPKSNFNNTRNYCLSCQSKIEQKNDNLDLKILKIINNPPSVNQQILQQNPRTQILIQPSESIIWSRQTQKKLSLEIIQQQSSDIHSLTDYLQSQRLSQTNGDLTNNSILDKQYRMKSTRSGQSSIDTQEMISDGCLTDKRDQKRQSFNSDVKTCHYLSDNINTTEITQSSRFVNIKNDRQFFEDFVLKTSKKHVNQANYSDNFCGFDQGKKFSHPDPNQQIKSKERIIAINKSVENICSHIDMNKDKQNYFSKPAQQLLSKSSSSDILHLGDSGHLGINLPRKLDSPKNIHFLKWGSARLKVSKDQRLKTQPSPRAVKDQLNKENNISQVKAETGRKILARKKTIMTHYHKNSFNKMDPLEPSPEKQVNLSFVKTNLVNSVPARPSEPFFNNFSTNISKVNESHAKLHHNYHSAGKIPHQLNRSLSKSKQKIKVTSKPTCKFMLDEVNGFKKKTNQVHLGAKLFSKRNFIEIKQALSIFNFNLPMNLIYWQKLGQDYGRGIYYGGIIYEGSLKQGKRYGQGRLIINGIEVYQGQWLNDCLHGQGYIKHLKMSKDCPKILQQGSFFGRFIDNKFEGMGTLFIGKQKIVTKFTQGIPIGQFTYYSQDNVEFGYWSKQ